MLDKRNIKCTDLYESPVMSDHRYLYVVLNALHTPSDDDATTYWANPMNTCFEDVGKIKVVTNWTRKDEFMLKPLNQTNPINDCCVQV